MNGQIPSGSYVIKLPLRDAHGRLRLTPALLPRGRDTADDYLPLTRANLIRQSFKFLGERYGWGDMYHARDCSSFVSDIYRSMGVELPRNTGDQEASPALEHRLFTTADDAATRRAAVRKLQVGDLVYIPGHVMMVIGHRDGQPYVIHDTNGGSYLGADGRLRQAGFNGVVVTPLMRMMIDRRKSYVDEITSIVTIRR